MARGEATRAGTHVGWSLGRWFSVHLGFSSRLCVTFARRILRITATGRRVGHAATGLEVVVGNANSGRYPRLTPEERKRIIGFVADGMRSVDVAREVARSAGFVQRVVRDAGGVARRLDWDPSPARLSAAEREEIRSGLDEGASFRVIARGFGRATSTVSREVTRTAVVSVIGGGGRIAWRPTGPVVPNWPSSPVASGSEPRSRPGSRRSRGRRRRSRRSCGSSSPTIR